MKKSVSALRKLLALLIGIPILVLGIILIPLPGPGILVTLLGLYIISMEFEFAKPHMEKLKGKVEEIIRTAKAKK